MCTSDVTEYLFIIQSKTMDTVIIMFPNTCILLCCEMFTLSIEGSDVPKLPCVAMETVSMHIDTVVLYVYQYCRSIDTGNVITIHIKTADIVILVTISSHSYCLKTSQ